MRRLRAVHPRHFSTKFDVHSFTGIPLKKQHLVPTSGTYPKGFSVGSSYAGIKPATSSQPDLVIVASDTYSNGAAVFTRNEFPAASITASRRFLGATKGHGMRGVVANSGCGNTLSGAAGLADAIAMARQANKHLPGQQPLCESDKNTSSMLVMHTGVGGQRLPIDDILGNIPKLCQEGLGNSHDHWLKAAIGLCTTDTFPKLVSRTFSLPSGPTFSIAGITKGAGMVHPNMATTLGIICTDAPVTPSALQEALSAAADKSYNSISIDGDTSTNDMVALFANGAAAPANMTPIDNKFPHNDNYLAFRCVLEDFMADMAKLVVRDAEGASKFITIRVRGGPPSESQSKDWHGAAKRIASVIARSTLVKTAFYGQDTAVWGGIMAALGYSLLDTRFAGQGLIVPERTSIAFVDQRTGHLQRFLEKGVPVTVDETTSEELIAPDDVEVVVDLCDGEASNGEEVVFWTSDLTHDFVTINSGVPI